MVVMILGGWDVGSFAAKLLDSVTEVELAAVRDVGLDAVPPLGFCGERGGDTFSWGADAAAPCAPDFRHSGTWEAALLDRSFFDAGCLE